MGEWRDCGWMMNGWLNNEWMDGRVGGQRWKDDE